MNRIVLANSGGFRFQQLELDRNLFFVGDNGTGKTTLLRAILFYYLADQRAVGIKPTQRNFREFYFPTENSYILYYFPTHTTLLYWTQNGPRWLHSTYIPSPDQLSRDGELLPLRQVRELLKRGEYHLAKSEQEHKELIYRAEPGPRQFRLLYLPQYREFLELYRALYRVSDYTLSGEEVKGWLFKTLSSDHPTEIRHREHRERLGELAQLLHFYRELRQEGKWIEQLAQLVEEGEGLLNRLKGLRRELGEGYRLGEEELNLLNREIEGLKEERLRKGEQLTRIRRRLEGWLEQIQQQIGRLEGELQRVRSLQSRYSPEVVAQWEELVGRLPELEARRRELEQRVEELNRELSRWERRRREEIEQTRRQLAQIGERERQQLQQLRRQLEGEGERRFGEKEEEYRLRLEQLRARERQLEERDSQLRDQLEQLRGQLEEGLERFRDQLRGLEEQYRAQQRKLEQQRRQVEGELEGTEGLRRQLEGQLTRAQRRVEEQIKELEERFRRRQRELRRQIAGKKSLLESPPGSFKEFLDRQWEGWERELFPLLDEGLLGEPVERLKPELRRREAPILFRGEVKRRPTRRQLMEELARLEEQLREEERVYWAQLSELQARLEELQREYRRQLEQVAREREELEGRLAQLKREGEKVAEEYRQRLKGVKREERGFREKVEEEIGQLKRARGQLADERRQLERERRQLREWLQREKGEIKKWVERELQRRGAELRKGFNRERQGLEERLEELKRELRKGRGEREGQLEELRRQLEQLKGEVERAYRAQFQLEQYRQEVVPELQRLPRLEEELQHLRRREGRYRRWLERAEQAYLSWSRDRERLLEQLHQRRAKLEELLKSLAEEGLTPSLPLSPTSTSPNAGSTGSPSTGASSELSPSTGAGSVGWTPSRKFSVDRLANLYREYRQSRERLEEIRRQLRRIGGRLERFFGKVGGGEWEFHPNLEQLEELAEGEVQKVRELWQFYTHQRPTRERELLQELGNRLRNILSQEVRTFTDGEEAFHRQLRRLNRLLKGVNFGVISEIEIEALPVGREVLKRFQEVERLGVELSTLLEEGSLFWERGEQERKIQRLLRLMEQIERDIGKERFTVEDVVELRFSFREGGVRRRGLTHLREESSTGGSLLLKIAIVVGLLGLYLEDRWTGGRSGNTHPLSNPTLSTSPHREGEPAGEFSTPSTPSTAPLPGPLPSSDPLPERAPFFLLLDEVDILSAENQRRLQQFVNSRGLKVIYITPNAPLPEELEEWRIYYFSRIGEQQFLAQLIYPFQ